uniref:CRIB domain-containing protein n=1 Tax=Arion vulgaris TaxID=1028688 RepID=A0A0B7BW36_9EUPU
MAVSLMCLPCCIGGQPQPKRRARPRLDASMIGLPTDFRQTAHVGSNDVRSSPNLHSLHNHMSSKGDYTDHYSPGQLQLSVVDLPVRTAL